MRGRRAEGRFLCAHDLICCAEDVVFEGFVADCCGDAPHDFHHEDTKSGTKQKLGGHWRERGMIGGVADEDGL